MRTVYWRLAVLIVSTVLAVACGKSSQKMETSSTDSIPPNPKITDELLQSFHIEGGRLGSLSAIGKGNRLVCEANVAVVDGILQVSFKNQKISEDLQVEWSEEKSFDIGPAPERFSSAENKIFHKGNRRTLVISFINGKVQSIATKSWNIFDFMVCLTKVTTETKEMTREDFVFFLSERKSNLFGFNTNAAIELGAQYACQASLKVSDGRLIATISQGLGAGGRGPFERAREYDVGKIPESVTVAIDSNGMIGFEIDGKETKIVAQYDSKGLSYLYAKRKALLHYRNDCRSNPL